MDGSYSGITLIWKVKTNKCLQATSYFKVQCTGHVKSFKFNGLLFDECYKVNEHIQLHNDRTFTVAYSYIQAVTICFQLTM